MEGGGGRGEGGRQDGRGEGRGRVDSILGVDITDSGLNIFNSYSRE